MDIMNITFAQVIIWLIMAVAVGCVGELIAGRHKLDGFVGAIMLALLAILLVNGVFHFHITGEPFYHQVPLISTLCAAAILVAFWSGYAYYHE